MKTPITRHLSVLALTLAAAAPSAFADQFSWVDEAQADAAVERLEPGTVVGRWISHNGGAPTLYVLHEARKVSVESEYAEEDYFQVELTAEPLARMSPAGPEHDFQFRCDVMPPGEPVTFDVDLAYVYVEQFRGDQAPTIKMLRNLAAELDLRSDFFPNGAEIGQEWVEVPSDVVEEAARRAPEPQQTQPTQGLAGAISPQGEAPAEQATGESAGGPAQTPAEADEADGESAGGRAQAPAEGEQGLPLPQGPR